MVAQMALPWPSAVASSQENCVLPPEVSDSKYKPIHRRSIILAKILLQHVKEMKCLLLSFLGLSWTNYCNCNVLGA
jgi:hypothetical protein